MKSFLMWAAVLCFSSPAVFSDQTARAETAFQGTSKRYLSSHDLLRVFQQKFQRPSLSQECTSLTDLNRQFLGDSSPVTGVPLFKGPSPSYVKWYSLCLKEAIDRDYERKTSNPNELITHYIGSGAVFALVPSPQASAVKGSYQYSNPFEGKQWSSLPQAVQKLIIQFQMNKYIGPGVVQQEYAFMKRIQAQLAKAPAQDMPTILRNMSFLICTQDEFLTY